jgi:hypothetical protein
MTPRGTLSATVTRSGSASAGSSAQPVQAAIDLLEHAPVAQPVEGARMNAEAERLCRAETGRVATEQLNCSLRGRSQCVGRQDSYPSIFDPSFR